MCVRTGRIKRAVKLPASSYEFITRIQVRSPKHCHKGGGVCMSSALSCSSDFGCISKLLTRDNLKRPCFSGGGGFAVSYTQIPILCEERTPEIAKCFLQKTCFL